GAGDGEEAAVPRACSSVGPAATRVDAFDVRPRIRTSWKSGASGSRVQARPSGDVQTAPVCVPAAGSSRLPTAMNRSLNQTTAIMRVAADGPVIADVPPAVCHAAPSVDTHLRPPDGAS